MNIGLTEILIVFLSPFIAYIINALAWKKLPRHGDFVSILGIAIPFVIMLGLFFQMLSLSDPNFLFMQSFEWFRLSDNPVDIFKVGIYIDNLAIVMLTMVTGVATLIHIFSSYYMHGDPNYGRFFTYLSLFTGAMIGLVLSQNLLTLFIFWELMGFCSYALIGFYTEKDRAGYASMKAFLTTRVGDVILLLGIVALWIHVGSVSYSDIYQALASGSLNDKHVLGFSLIGFAAFCMICGTIGKSAQFPLQIWLPDAMMGPTPCSALIHAATMVAAGVYLLLRMYPLIHTAHLDLLVAYIGAITAFIAASIALVQKDLKAVLAYSTVSQLGYMVLGIGVAAYNASFMHLITHAIFKACLFLSAGSVIHSLHDDETGDGVQELARMGGLRKKLPLTHLAMLLATLAISGVPFFSGFVSKDRILGDALFWSQGINGGSFLYLIPTILGFISAVLTPFYMFRMMILAFYGETRDKKLYDHCHHEHFAWNSNLPLLILGFLSLGVFFSGSLTGQSWGVILPSISEWFSKLMVPVFGSINMATATTEVLEHAQHSAHHTATLVSLALAATGIGFAFLFYFWKIFSSENLSKSLHGIYNFLSEKWYLDKILMTMTYKVSRFFYSIAKWFDNVFIDAILVDGSAVLVNLGNIILRYMQSGHIQRYVTVMVVGVVSYLMYLAYFVK
ncbi:MAG: NADH-quinone oxidoreductase subunit L [Bacteriovoracaceae bacterium]|nr:NADH-quinone oxidoreductase subunit L [Bacteriovoracaceae bacterium]